ncbi:MAG TPA: DUF998 domain-containing protein [Thermomicrobiaceae bacterium]|nr:DUF998 domain-containing protein [Thermomicrobiaceae bacterium]
MPTIAVRRPHESGAANAGRQHTTGLLAWLAVAGVAVYVVLDVIAQTLPPHYSPIRQAESDLAVGPYGWIMTVNFVVRGLLSAAVLAALWRTLAPSGRTRLGLSLLGVWTAGAFLLAMFPTDVGSTSSTHGKVHLAVALVAFVCIPIAEHLLSRSMADAPHRAALAARVTPVAYLALAALVLLLVGTRVPRIGGLTERIFLAAVLLWLLLVALDLCHPGGHTA